MNILGNKKKSEVIYEHLQLGVLVAISNDNNSLVRAFFKKYKGKKSIPSDKISGYKMVVDEEFDSLKIDFSTSFYFLIQDLKLFPLK
tara:strand:- start:967 stop:1227 length:261 start_codon:yes stop_codon:yes gene_type:complete